MRPISARVPVALVEVLRAQGRMSERIRARLAALRAEDVPSPERVRVSIRLDEADVAHLQSLCEATGCQVSDIITLICEDLSA